MQNVFPDYYKDFKCLKGECRHNCCIGWEIDIDDDTAEDYRNIKGKFGDRLRQNISAEGERHFILDKDERCPFLNNDNLCDIIINLGEDRLCDICDRHPRFHNELPDRVESGLGLCCEAAGRLILGKKEPMRLICDEESEDDIIILRDRLISVLQDRRLSVDRRVDRLIDLAGCGRAIPMTSFIRLLFSLERLDDEWTRKLTMLKDELPYADLQGFDLYMTDRMAEYERLLVYFIYRHLANASDMDEAAARACFAVMSYRVIHAMGAVMWTKSNAFAFEDQVELARLYSSEIEYSNENLYIILNSL